MTILRMIARLLAYPRAEMAEAMDDLARLTDAMHSLSPSARAGLRRLAEELAGGDELDLQERYVGLFDRTRSLSLHLFEHVYGDSRERGQAMAALIARYRAHGMEPLGAELPDYLPMYLEFLSLLPPERAAALLNDVAPIIAKIADRLTRRGSPYAAPFLALMELSGAEALAAVEPESDEDSPEAIDRAWSEAPVMFGADDPSLDQQAGCGKAAIQARAKK